MSENYRPPGYHTLTPYLVCKGAADAIEFYKNAFGAEELFRLEYPQGGIGHAEIRIGDSPVMLADEHPDMNILGPATLGNSPVSLQLYVPNVDEFFAQALAAGAKQVRPVEEQFYGDRAGRLEDPFGYHWHVATAAKPVSKEEMLKLWDEMMKKGAGE